MFGIIGAIIGLVVVVIYLIFRFVASKSYQAIHQKSRSDGTVSPQRKKPSPPVARDYTTTRIILLAVILAIVLPFCLFFLYGIFFGA